MKLRKGDTVQVMTGKDRGKRGEVQRVLPASNKVIVTGVNTATKHAKARRANDKAGIIDRDMPIDASNVMLVHKGKPVRVGYELRDGKKVRVARVAQGKTEVIG
jgi:large subunit ribosomal protein L24